MFNTLGGYYIWAHDRYREVFKELNSEEFNSIDKKMGKSIRQLLEHLMFVTKFALVEKEEDLLEYAEEWMELMDHELIDQWRLLDLEVHDALKNIDPMKKIKFQPLGSSESLIITESEYYLMFTDHMTFHRGQFLTALKHLDKPGISSDLYYYILEREHQ
ncbi:MAG: hypothetical protein INQ03_20245 [Candidatus Heimdallarchaeota archaeon]|nr:hypothetical protein [Candidatus Heimdallarchaeota archaeon]